MLKLLVATLAGGATYYLARGPRCRQKLSTQRQQRSALQSMDRRRRNPAVVLKRELILAGGAVAVALANAASGAGFGALVVVLLLPQRVGYFRETYQVLRQQRRANMALLDCVVFVALMATCKKLGSVHCILR